MARAESLLNAFTVDLEDWYQGLTSTNPRVDLWPILESRVVAASTRLLEVLRPYGVQATFFVLGYVADHHPALIERIHSEGHEIGVHGYYHRFVYRQRPEEFASELERSMQAVERITGETPLGHRAPYFSVNGNSTWAFQVMEAQGLRYDSSVFPTRNTLYGYPTAPRFPYQPDGLSLIEFPVSTVRIGPLTLPMAGGFYLRLLPYALVRWAIRQLNEQGRPAILYLHPWELDLGQTYRQVTFRERITHYHGRRGLERKLHRLFSDFCFGPLRTLLHQGLERSDQ
jgi:polysaccharide deacetylase family protein (PEP-CTERM system associated)